jgi:hypothetical protein
LLESLLQTLAPGDVDDSDRVFEVKRGVNSCCELSLPQPRHERWIIVTSKEAGEKTLKKKKKIRTRHAPRVKLDVSGMVQVLELALAKHRCLNVLVDTVGTPKNLLVLRRDVTKKNVC